MNTQTHSTPDVSLESSAKYSILSSYKTHKKYDLKNLDNIINADISWLAASHAMREPVNFPAQSNLHVTSWRHLFPAKHNVTSDTTANQARDDVTGEREKQNLTGDWAYQASPSAVRDNAR